MRTFIRAGTGRAEKAGRPVAVGFTLIELLPLLALATRTTFSQELGAFVGALR